MWSTLKMEPSDVGGFGAATASLGSLVGAYYLQRMVLVRHFDEGGVLSLDWKKGTESLGEPLKITTWRHFYRAAGPPVFARVGALIVSFYIAGVAHGWVASRSERSEMFQREEAHKARQLAAKRKEQEEQRKSRATAKAHAKTSSSQA